jgi:hypothetical protein
MSDEINLRESYIGILPEVTDLVTNRAAEVYHCEIVTTIYLLNKPLMCESEIQSLITDVCCCHQIMRLFLDSHRTPQLLPLSIPQNIINLRQNIQHNIQHSNSNQDFIPAFIIRRVVRSVDVGADDTADLAAHVVKGRGDCSCSNRVCIARLQTDLDSVDIGIREDESEEGIT